MRGFSEGGDALIDKVWEPCIDEVAEVAVAVVKVVVSNEAGI